MKTETGIITVEMCMGSSCYSRGNSTAVQLIEAFIDDNGLDGRLFLKGRLCTGSCSNGPCMKIDESSYSAVRPEDALSLIKKHLET